MNTPGDIPQFRGLMLTPTTRETDKRPTPDFVKAYMHNGVFKSLKQVVHFYNKRNIAVDAKGNEVAFDLRVGPPSGTTPLFPPPEVLDNVQNVAGLTPAQAAAAGTTGVTASNGQVGNLGLSDQQENDLVAFLGALSDGFFKPAGIPFIDPTPIAPATKVALKPSSKSAAPKAARKSAAPKAARKSAAPKAATKSAAPKTAKKSAAPKAAKKK
jgi:hypothetical protein